MTLQPVTDGTKSMTVLVDFDPRNLDTILHAVGPNTRVLTSLDALDHYLIENPHEYVVVLAPSVGVSAAFDLAERMRIERPALGVILVQASDRCHDALGRASGRWSAGTLSPG
jgi:hypothetical protein